MKTIKQIYILIALYFSQLAYNVKSERYNSNWFRAFYRQHREGIDFAAGSLWFFAWLAFWLVCLSLALK